MQIKKFETEWAGKKLRVEVSDLADQAGGSVLVRYGETAVFAAATMSAQKREGLDYFPLMVDYEEKFYAAGLILGSRFVRREGKPSEEAVLTGRLIDRTIRPLFDKSIRNEVQVVASTLSVDGKNDPDTVAIIAASLALGISDIPWGGPVGAARIGYDGTNFMFNPVYEERTKSSLDIMVCGKDGKINMIEAGAKQVPEDIIARSFTEALKEIARVEEFQKMIIKEAGKEKIKVEKKEKTPEMVDLFNKNILNPMEKVIYESRTTKPDLSPVKTEWSKIFGEKFGEDNLDLAEDIFEEGIDKLVHDKIIDAAPGAEKRQDGRRVDEVRSVHAGVGYLPMLHGSGVFYRGQTHILSAVTLGGPQDALLIEGMEISTSKHFMHHYNFPPFSVGETGRMGSPGRREIGHGALVEKALSAVVPPKEEFPYTIRIVSESMASNGSTSQGSVCASTLALMDAGVPIKKPVAGISMGLMMRNEKEYKVITDIQGFEDHFGDMDFKCAGTDEGITAIQLDVKVDGIPAQILEEALMGSKKARTNIMEVMLKAIPEPRKELPAHAPRVVKMMINPDKIREVIGPGGKMINSIIDKTGTEIDIEQDGSVFITGKNLQATDEARKIIEGLTREYAVGEIVEGPVSRMFDFGAMVEIGPMQEGLVHVSELAPFRVNKVTDVVNIGDKVKAKIISIDEKGRINLSMKQLDPNYNPENDPRSKPRGEGFGHRGRSNNHAR
ncbi:MAG: polyribonucleotide nucleotidyltransferase [Candidatus Pacebacteria bacterium]|nr:polyribonucleotide nucleotidyltransferase [Candidatus Paceibacterota bacterium]